jgi:hypothetical protein
MGGLNSKRCNSCQTLYQSAMRAIRASLLLILFCVSPGLAKNRHCMLRIHTEANPHDTAVFSTAVKAQLSGKEVAIEKYARITEQDVQAFYPYPLGKGQFAVLFQLDEHGKVALDELSVERHGGFLFVFINGRPVTELQIDKRVTDGQIYIPSGLTSADIELMKRDWKIIGQRRR